MGSPQPAAPRRSRPAGTSVTRWLSIRTLLDLGAFPDRSLRLRFRQLCSPKSIQTHARRHRREGFTRGATPSRRKEKVRVSAAGGRWFYLSQIDLQLRRIAAVRTPSINLWNTAILSSHLLRASASAKALVVIGPRVSTECQSGNLAAVFRFQLPNLMQQRIAVFARQSDVTEAQVRGLDADREHPSPQCIHPWHPIRKAGAAHQGYIPGRLQMLLAKRLPLSGSQPSGYLRSHVQTGQAESFLRAAPGSGPLSRTSAFYQGPALG